MNTVRFFYCHLTYFKILAQTHNGDYYNALMKHTHLICTHISCIYHIHTHIHTHSHTHTHTYTHTHTHTHTHTLTHTLTIQCPGCVPSFQLISFQTFLKAKPDCVSTDCKNG